MASNKQVGFCPDDEMGGSAFEKNTHFHFVLSRALGILAARG